MGRPKQVSDEVLLGAAREVFTEQGYGASTRTIAERAGASEAVLYQRHKTKLDLFFAAMVPEPCATDWLAEADSGDVVTDLGTIALRLMGYFRSAMPVLVRLTSHPSFRVEELAARGQRLPLLGLGAALLDHLDQRRRAGAIAADPATARTVVLSLLAALHSFALFEMMGVHGGAVISDAEVRRVARLHADGLSPRRQGKA
jgi:AcrR family transcriptional regulator